MLSTWGSTETWSEFFAGAEISRGRLDSLDVFERGSFIQHCDRDCLLVVPKGPVPMVDRVLYPWLDRVRKIGRPTEGPGGEAPRRHGTMRTTDLRERDVVMGGLEKLEKVLEHAVAEGVPDMLFLSCTCVPFVTGEDVESLVKRYRPRVERPFFFLTTTPQSSNLVFREVLVHRRRAAEAAAGPPAPGSVNLIGYAGGPPLAELRGLLAEAGVRVNATFVPEMNFAAIDALPGAPVHVLFPNVLWQSIYDQLLFESRIAAVMPPAPFGLGGTGRWLAEVCRAAGVEADAPGIVERAFAPHAAELGRLREEARGHRLGFVVGADAVHRLCDPASTWGVPLVPLLEELGFGLDVLIRAHDRRSAHEAAKKVHALFADPSRHSIKAFADRERLVRLLEAGPFAAVYSDHMFDERLGAAGKAQFSLQEFEPGPAGTVRTARRLLAICRLPFFRRYRRHLAAAAAAPAGEPGVKPLEVLPAASACAPAGAEDFTDRVSLTFSIGVYLAVNAIRDAYLLVDAPDCAHLKTQFVQGQPRLVLDPDLHHRLPPRGEHRPAPVEDGRGPRRQDRGAPRAHRLAPARRRRAHHLPPDGDHHRARLRPGHPPRRREDRQAGGEHPRRRAERGLARRVRRDPEGARARAPARRRHAPARDRGRRRLPHGSRRGRPPREPRGAPAHRGVARATLASVWPSGGPVADLLAIREASVVVSMPYGREAARLVAQRTGAVLVETELPLGLGATEAWIRQVAEAAGVPERADAVVDAQLGPVVRSIEWVVPYYPLHRRLVFVGEPHLGLAVGGLADELGMGVEHYFVLNRRSTPASSRSAPGRCR